MMPVPDRLAESRLDATEPAHTPYAGTTTPFTIGLKPLDRARWLEIDRHFGDYLDEKRRLLDTRRELVFAEEDDTRDAQEEVLALVVSELSNGFPALYPDTRAWETALAAMEAAGSLSHEPPLLRASLMVQEDLVLMRRGEDGWRLAAASLCFPSSWSLAEKFGRPLQAIHRPVPGFGPDSRNAQLIERIFDRLQVDQPVERLNWSLQTDAERYKPLSHDDRAHRATARPARFDVVDPVAAAFIRVERQTLRKLPASGDILFTIRIFVDPMATLAAHPDRALLAGSLAGQLAALDTAQLDYKGLTADRDRLAGALRSLAAG